MDKKKKIIICISVVLLAIIAVCLCICFNKKNNPEENTTKNATFNDETYLTITEETNLYLQNNKDKTVITIPENTDVLVMSEKTYSDEEGNEYIKVLYTTEDNTIYFGYIEKPITNEDDESKKELEIVGDTNVNVGESIELKTTSEKENENLAWSSGDEEIATVTNEGVVTGKKAGTVDITVKTEKEEATKKITVKPTTATGIELNKSEINININKTKTTTLTATVTPENVEAQKISWESEDPSIATVTVEEGKPTTEATITIKFVGKTTITAKTEDGKVKATCNLIITRDTKNMTIMDSDSFSVKTQSIGEITRPLQQMDIQYDSEGNVLRTYYNFQFMGRQYLGKTKIDGLNQHLKKGNYNDISNMYKSVYIMKKKENNEYKYKRIYYSNGGHGMVFSPVAYRNDSIYAYGDFIGFIYPDKFDTDVALHKYTAGSLKSNILYLNFNNVDALTKEQDENSLSPDSISFASSGSINCSSNSFNNSCEYKSSLNFGMSILEKGKETTYYSNDFNTCTTAKENKDKCAYNSYIVDGAGTQINMAKGTLYNKQSNSIGNMKLNSSNKYVIGEGPVAYDQKSGKHYVVTWTKKTRLDIFSYNSIKNQIIKVRRNGNSYSSSEKPISVSVENSDLYRNGIAVHNGIIYLLYSTPNVKTEVKIYDINKKTWTTKTIDLEQLKKLGYSNIEGEGIQIREINGKPYIHIGVAYKNGGRWYSSIIRYEG